MFNSRFPGGVMGEIDYSQLEVSRKRAALENVLVPETVAEHRARLDNCGFEHTAVWLRYFNFVSIVAIK